MSTGKGKAKVTHEQEDIEQDVHRTRETGDEQFDQWPKLIGAVQCLIERCMLRYLNQKEVTNLLYEELKIEPWFTTIVWEELEKKNKVFFENYNSMLIMIELNETQAARDNELMKNTVASQPCTETTGFNMPSIDKSGGNLGSLRFFCLFIWAVTVKFDHGASSSLLENMSTKRNEEMQMVKNLIEQCLVHYMNQNQVMDVLHQKENIEPSFTKTVWQHLEEQNQEFFKNYYLRLAVKDQIIRFNSLLEMQAVMMKQMNPNEFAALEIDRSRPGNLGLQLQAPPSMTSSSADHQQSR